MYKCFKWLATAVNIKWEAVHPGLENFALIHRSQLLIQYNYKYMSICGINSKCQYIFIKYKCIYVYVYNSININSYNGQIRREPQY